MTSARIHGIPSGTEKRQLQLYFSDPAHGGWEVDKIYYPLHRNEAVITFRKNADVTGLFERNHTISGASVTVCREPNKVYRNVTTQLEPRVTQLLDQNSSHLDHLQFNGDLEVTFDPDSMNYLVSGNWYQLEWAWFYLENACTEVEKIEPEEEIDVLETDSPRGDNDGTNELKQNIEDAISLSSTDSDEVTSFPGDIDGGRINGIPVGNISPELWKDAQNPSDPGDESNIGRRSPDDTTREPFPKLPFDYGSTFPNTKPRSNFPTRCRFDRGKHHGVYNRRRNVIDVEAFYDNSWKPNFRRNPSSPCSPNSPIPSNDFMFSNSDSEDEFLPFHRHGLFDMNERLMSEASRYDIPPTENRRKEETQSNTDIEKAQLSMELNIGPLLLKVEFGDLLTARTDAIVSPASTDLTNQYGVAAVISRAAGHIMDKECRDYIDKRGSLCIGDVIHTCAGGTLNKHVGFILHVAGPSWREDSADETAHLLTCTYLNCFHYANRQLWLKTIAMPLISAGILGVPLDVCIQSFHDALLLHVLGDDSTRHLQEVTLLNNDKESACATVVILRSLTELDENEAQKAAIERYRKGCRKSEFQAKHCVLNNSTPNEDNTKYLNDDHGSTTNVSNTENINNAHSFCNFQEEGKSAKSKIHPRKRPNKTDCESEEIPDFTLPSAQADEDDIRYSLKQPYLPKGKEKVSSSSEMTNQQHEKAE
ncbi:hypothetical protein FSP39_014506 [Pinctada imbricata]|uniref:Macro domain-containing protein n=1 Tax=Pinctada imbricata TaxID=66713 RepID=A0AA88XUW5_PINIB|nr:hypothetical protein FSP39_014506 [Pinctada imbricata]